MHGTGIPGDPTAGRVALEVPCDGFSKKISPFWTEDLANLHSALHEQCGLPLSFPIASQTVLRAKAQWPFINEARIPESQQ